jgi:hypothetical protein
VPSGVDVVFYAPINPSFEILATNNVMAPLPWPVATFRLLSCEPLTNNFPVNPL